MVELIGYVALVLALIAMLSNNIIVLRGIHLMSCSFYATYGFIKESYPITVGAILISCIHLHHRLQYK